MRLNVLSLFDGISCGQLALQDAGIEYYAYYASEVDKYAKKVTQSNFPNTVQIGDVRNIVDPGPKMDGVFDLLLGGSPCQSFSIANILRKGFNSEHGKLFYEFIKVMDYIQPKWFLYENVGNMTVNIRNFISHQLGVQPVLIDSANFSAQSRKRYYWTNIPIPKFKEFDNYERVYDIRERCLDSINTNDIVWNKTHSNKWNNNKPVRLGYIKNTNRGNRIYAEYGKSIALTASSGGIGRNTGLYNFEYPAGNGFIDVVRKLTPIECERLQTIPDNYTSMVSSNQRYKLIGNAWTVKVISHILKGIK